MTELRALSGARFYRREPIGGAAGRQRRGRPFNNRDVKTKRKARETKEELAFAAETQGSKV
jgi:hypothetical protein